MFFVVVRLLLLFYGFLHWKNVVLHVSSVCTLFVCPFFQKESMVSLDLFPRSMFKRTMVLPFDVCFDISLGIQIPNLRR